MSPEGVRLLIRGPGFRKLSPRPIHPKADPRKREEFRSDFKERRKPFFPRERTWTAPRQVARYRFQRPASGLGAPRKSGTISKATARTASVPIVGTEAAVVVVPHRFECGRLVHDLPSRTRMIFEASDHE